MPPSPTLCHLQDTSTAFPALLTDISLSSSSSLLSSSAPVPVQALDAYEVGLQAAIDALRAYAAPLAVVSAAVQASAAVNRQLASRVTDTSRLLDVYTTILSQQEHTQRLLSNPLWGGASEDEERLAQRYEREAQRRKEEEARALREQQQAAARAAEASAVSRRGAGRGSVRGSIRGAGAGARPMAQASSSVRGGASLRQQSAGSGIPGRSAATRARGVGSGIGIGRGRAL